MYLAELLFIKLMLFIIDKRFILLVYRNELDPRISLIVKPSFHVAKHGGGRGDGHIHIVFEIDLLAKLLFAQWSKNSYT